MELDAPVTILKGVGKANAEKFELLGIKTVGDLLDYLPRTYRDYTEVLPIVHLKPGTVVFKAAIKQAKGRYVRRGMHITEAVASDDSGSVRLVWFNQPYRADALKPDTEYFVTGTLALKRQRFAVTNPSIELVSDLPVHTARIIPVYKETKGVTSQQIRRAIAQTVFLANKLPEIVPDSLRKQFDLMSYGEAVKELHYPSTKEKFVAARRSLGFSEVFELMLAAQLNKAAISDEKAPEIKFNEPLAKKFVSNLPFTLTDSQRQSAWQILQDMQLPVPMNRLLEGDVGSGKTVVAGMSALMAMAAGYQVALLAPTELLARQHADTLYELFKSVGQEEKLLLLTGSFKAKAKSEAKEKISSGAAGCIVGTQALLQESVKFHSLGLLIVDEQHRFGVEQRKKLIKDNTFMPHVLSMTATPIPRSLALTLYGELTISLLKTMPLGRKPIETKIVSPNSRDGMYKLVHKEIKEGRQVYVVCPVIATGEATKAPSAEDTYKKLSQGEFKKYKLGLLHGKLNESDKQAVMQKFINKEIDVLVSTTVIEVGISVSNASVMIIEGAERFGLAQMHQLRGRVGRGEEQGYCFIVPSDSSSPSPRLRAIEQSTDGFALAELDLELRGPGAIYGTLQHGALDLRVARLSDSQLLSDARQGVDYFIQKKLKINEYPALALRVRAAQAVVTLN